jgi:hypothetical protein
MKSIRVMRLVSEYLVFKGFLFAHGHSFAYGVQKKFVNML